MDYFVVSLLFVSALFNLVLCYLFYKKKHILTVDAQRLLSEMLSGQVVVDIRVIDATGLFYRSPKG